MTGRIVVVGAGVTGLAAAHRLRSASPERDVLVLEREERPGGKVGAVTVGGLELEAGPDSFLARKPWAVELCGDLGLGDDLVPAALGSTQLWTEHGLVPFPPGPLGIPTSVGELWRADALRPLRSSGRASTWCSHAVAAPPTSRCARCCGGGSAVEPPPSSSSRSSAGSLPPTPGR